MCHGTKPAAMNIGSLEVLSIATQYDQSTNGCVAIWKNLVVDGERATNTFSEPFQVGIANEHLIKYERIIAPSRNDSMTGF